MTSYDGDGESFNGTVANEFHVSMGSVNAGFASIKKEIDGSRADAFYGTYFTAPLGDVFTLAAVQRIDRYRLTCGADAEFALDEDPPAGGGIDGDATRSLEGYTVVNAVME
ncbi:hypothetical protein [Fulvimarina sp. MAC8]|uniref:hypothetical protein n=1 Tax=Fulvimarina sp. MAC8 TaxID=3162874 RepID=UPI0032EBD18C